MIIHALRSERVMTITLNFISKRPDHLGVAQITPLTDVDVASRQLQRGVRPYAIDHFMVLFR